jgi:hypothetical protein
MAISNQVSRQSFAFQPSTRLGLLDDSAALKKPKESPAAKSIKTEQIQWQMQIQ